MLKLILSPFRCCLSPPSIPILIPAPIPLPDPIPDPIPDADVAEQETAEEEIDPIVMLAARAGRSARLQPSLDSILFPAPRRRVFKPSLDAIIEDPEAEEEAERADQLDILKASLELWAQAAKAELRAEAIRAELEERKAELELEAEAARAEHEESKVAPNHKRRQNWMKRVLSKCKRRGGRDQRENREAGFRVRPTGSVSMLSNAKIYK